MKVHLVDGTYELFRHYFAVPSARNDAGQLDAEHEAPDPDCHELCCHYA